MWTDARADVGAAAGARAPSPHSPLAQPGPKQIMKAVLPGIFESIYRNQKCSYTRHTHGSQEGDLPPAAGPSLTCAFPASGIAQGLQSL